LPTYDSALHWFRRDLRDDDNAGLFHALKSARRVHCAFVFDRDGKATAAFGVPHTSYVVVIDRNRKVVYTGVGGTQNIDAAIRKASLE